MRVSRIGDVTSHGGVIVTGASTVRSDGIPVARIGDIGICVLPEHPSTFIIVTGSGTTEVENLPVAREGSATTCGAIIVSGGSWEDNG